MERSAAALTLAFAVEISGNLLCVRVQLDHCTQCRAMAIDGIDALQIGGDQGL